MQPPRTCDSYTARILVLAAVSLLWQACNGEDLTDPTTGEITVTVSTTGAEPDPDGYTLSLDGLQGVAIASNETRTLTADEGDHTLELGGLASNCGVEGGIRLAVQVVAGDTTAVAFEVVCSATTGGLRIVTSTTGDLADPDGYAVSVDQGEPQPIDANGAVTVTALAPGDHIVQLSGVAQECTVAGDTQRTVTVAARELVELTFAITCTAGVQQWTPMASGTGADLVDVWGSSATDVFVVGEEETEDGQFEVASVIRHYDGTDWAPQFREVDLILRSVWGSSPADVFAVGLSFVSPEARVLHFDGSRWSEVPGFTPGQDEQFALESVWGSSATDVFAVGSVFDGPFEESLIFHYDGSSWRRMPVTGPVKPGLLDVWGSSGTDVYAVGRVDDDDPSTGVILRYDGASWSPVREVEGLAPTSIWGSSAADIFVAGFQVEERDDEFLVFGTIFHYEGARWSRVALPAPSILHEIWGSSAPDVFAVGDDGVVLHYDGTDWTAMNPTTNGLLGVWGSSPGDVFAVGNGGTILHGTP
jgi:hypothetical protein